LAIATVVGSILESGQHIRLFNLLAHENVTDLYEKTPVLGRVLGFGIMAVVIWISLQIRPVGWIAYSGDCSLPRPRCTVWDMGPMTLEGRWGYDPRSSGRSVVSVLKLQAP